MRVISVAPSFIRHHSCMQSTLNSSNHNYNAGLLPSKAARENPQWCYSSPNLVKN